MMQPHGNVLDDALLAASFGPELKPYDFHNVIRYFERFPANFGRLHGSVCRCWKARRRAEEADFGILKIYDALAPARFFVAGTSKKPSLVLGARAPCPLAGQRRASLGFQRDRQRGEPHAT